MAAVNKVILVGNLGRAPESKSLRSGEQLATFSIATTEKWTDRNGQKQERTEWHRITAFGRLADTCTRWLDKGRTVYVEGRLKTSEWTDEKGQRRFSTEIIAEDVKFIGPRPTDRGEGAPQTPHPMMFASALDELPTDLPN